MQSIKLRDFKTAKERREYLEQLLNISIRSISVGNNEERVESQIENAIGTIAIPTGVVGPISIKSSLGTKKDYMVPLSTTEGALLASVNRGCRVISNSNGAFTHVDTNGVTRGPVFETSGIAETLRLKAWIKANEELIKTEAEKTSNHLKLIKIGIRHTTNRLFARFYFDCDEAMGMNMVTIATQSACELISLNTDIVCQSIAGNFDIDKKPAWLNVISGRGKQCYAEAIISKEDVSTILKTDVNKLYSVWLSKCIYGSYMSGSLGFNSQFANIVAAFFMATGQDVAHTVEGSLGITTTKITVNGDLYISIYLPSILIGTIGGGTGLPAQTEARAIIGAKNANELAEVLAGVVLAGELSLLASVSQGTLASAHKKLGRLKLSK